MDALMIFVLVVLCSITAFVIGVHLWIRRAGLGDRDFASDRGRITARVIESVSALFLFLFFVLLFFDTPKGLLFVLLVGAWVGMAVDALINLLRARRGVPIAETDPPSS